MTARPRQYGHGPDTRPMIGTAELLTPLTMTRRYEVAAWWATVQVLPQVAEMRLSQYPGMIYIGLRGTLTEDFTPSLYGGVMVGSKGVEKRNEETWESVCIRDYSIWQWLASESRKREYKVTLNAEGAALLARHVTGQAL